MSATPTANFTYFKSGIGVQKSDGTYVDSIGSDGSIDAPVTTTNLTTTGNTTLGDATSDTTAINGATTITTVSSNGLTVGPNGATNPTLHVNASIASEATGISIVGAAAGAGVNLRALSSGTDENLTINAKGAGTITFAPTSTGAISLARATSITGAATVTSASANALAVGLAGATNPALNVDASTASSATGLNIKSAAAAAGLALSVSSSGTDESMTLNAKGAGRMDIGSTSTGMMSMARGSLSQVLAGSTTAALGTTQNSTPTAAQLLGGIVTQTGATGAGTVTTPTGTALSSAIAGVTVGDSFRTRFANLGGGQTLTITAGASGMTIIGTATVATATNIDLLFVNTAANTWLCYTNK